MNFRLEEMKMFLLETVLSPVLHPVGLFLVIF